jgi:hypothetical protein
VPTEPNFVASFWLRHLQFHLYYILFLIIFNFLFEFLDNIEVHFCTEGYFV